MESLYLTYLTRCIYPDYMMEWKGDVFVFNDLNDTDGCIAFGNSGKCFAGSLRNIPLSEDYGFRFIDKTLTAFRSEQDNTISELLGPLSLKQMDVYYHSYTVNINGSGPLITTCFWGKEDGVFSCDSLTDYLALGGTFIYDVLVSGRNAINKFWVDEVGDSEDLNHLAETIYRSKLFGENYQSTIANIEFRGEEISVFFRKALQDFLGNSPEG